MRFLAVTALLPVCLYLIPAARSAETSQVPTVQVTPEQAAQRPSDDDEDPRDNRRTPLTPEEEMQRQIRLFDPLDRGTGPETPGPRNQSQNQNQNQNQSQNQNSGVRQPNYPAPLNAPESRAGNADNSGVYEAAPETEDQALPGSVEATALENRTPGLGPRVEEESAEAQTGEYTGPAVLTRAYSINTLAIPNDLRFHESVSFSEVWDSNTAAPGPNSTSPATGGTSGASIGWGFSGQHLLNKTDMLGFAYSGSATAYTSTGGYNGANHRVTLNYSHAFTRRLGLTFVNNGSVYSANYAVQNPVQTPGTSIANVNLASSPTLQPYSSGSKQFNTLVGLNWQQTARLSWNFSGGYFVVAQDGPGLVGAMGMQAQGGVNYRYSRRTTVGLYYSYSHTAYPHGLGSSDTNSVGLSYALALNQTTQIRLRAGVAQTEALAETPAVVPPLVYILFGTPFAIVDEFTRRSTGDFSGQIVKDLGRNMAGSLAYVHGMSPGNGQLLTSTQQVFSASFSMRLQRVYTLGFSGTSQSLSAVAQTMSESYHVDVAQISLARKYRGGIAANVSASYSYFGHSSPFLRPYEIHVSSGISWSPPALKLWPF